MNNLTRALLIALRLAIGWHFFYEGLYKLDSDTGAVLYTPARYPIQTATARLRDFFAQPSWTLPEAVVRVDAWNDEIVKVFKGRQPLSEDQKARLNTLSDKIKLTAQAHLRTGAGDIINFDWTQVHEDVLRIAPTPEPERFSSLGYLQNSAGPLRPLFRALVTDIDGLERLTPASLRSRLAARHDETLRHFATHNQPFSKEQITQLEKARDQITAAAVDTLQSPAFQTRLADYRLLQSRVTADQSRLHAPFTRERLDAARKKLDLIAAEMLAFVNEPLAEYVVQMQSIANAAQLAAGPLPRPADGARWVDRSITWLLLAIGACLLLGLATPVAALAAAAQLLIFYLASPPWPHLPAASMAGHYLFVDRNFIEALAALLVAATPSGLWAGLDFYLLRRRQAPAQN